MADNTNLFEQGIALFGKREYTQAKEIFIRLVSENGENNPEALFRLGFCLEHEKDYDQAEIYYKKIASCETSRELAGDAFFRIAWMARGKENHQEAIYFFNLAVAELRESSTHQNIYNEALYWQAVSYEVCQQPLKALEIYDMINDQCLMLDVYFHKVLCNDKVGRYQKALANCRQFEDVFMSEKTRDGVEKLWSKIQTIKQQLEDLDFDETS